MTRPNGLYLSPDGDTLEYYKGQDDVFNITKGVVSPIELMLGSELMEEIEM
jgi:hypothetical protein